MSGEVADTARRYREALRAGDVDTALDLLHDDVVLVLPRGTLSGIDAARALLRAETPLENLAVETRPGELEHVNGSRVRSRNTQLWRWRETGDVAYERRSEAEYTVRDGKIARVEVRILA